MVSIAASFADGAPRLRAPAYHGIVSKLLQRQFVHACVCILTLCYPASWYLGSRHGIWSFFPWSWTGFRAIGLFMAFIPLLLTRKANLHVYDRRRRTVLSTIVHRIVQPGTALVLASYGIAAFVLVRLYIDNCASARAVGMLVTHRPHELPRVNERWIYLMFASGFLGLTDAVIHIVRDVDRLRFPDVKRPIPDAIKADAPGVLLSSGVQATATTIAMPFAYLAIRSALYRNTLSVVRLFYRLPRSSALPGWPVGLDMLAATWVTASLLFTLSNSANWCFDAYLTQGPVRKGRLASDKSAMADDTLIDGLNASARPLSQYLAFEELLHIACHVARRRVGIFEAGRKDAVAWQGVLGACMTIVREVTEDLEDALRPPGRPGVQQPGSASSHPQRPQQQQQERTQQSASVPGTPPPVQVQQANIFVTGKQPASPFDRFKSAPTQVASAAGGAPNAVAPIQPASRAAEHAAQSLTLLGARVHDRYAKLLRGTAFEHWLLPSAGASFIRAAERAPLLSIAVQALVQLLLRSLEEDPFGRVFRDVARTRAAFAKAADLAAAAERACSVLHQQPSHAGASTGTATGTGTGKGGDAKPQQAQSSQPTNRGLLAEEEDEATKGIRLMACEFRAAVRKIDDAFGLYLRQAR